MKHPLMLLLCTGCFGSSETPFQPGLEPLDDMAVEAPDGFVEDYATTAGEGSDYNWAQLRGYVHADMADVWDAYKIDDVVVDRQRVASWSSTTGVEPEYDFSMAVDHVVEDTITLEYVVNWRHGVAAGTVDAPEKMSMRWQKTSGSDLINLLEGSVVLLETSEEGVVEVQMIEHLKAPLTGTEDILRLLEGIYVDVVATVHGEPLPEYDE